MLQEKKPGSVNVPLWYKSQQRLSETLMRVYQGKNDRIPDVTLSLQGKKLPAHRFLLAESSRLLKAMFQAGVTGSLSSAV